MKYPAVLILCHKGVQNPKVWLDWASCEHDYPIKLFALCENGQGSGSGPDDLVCQQHGIRISNLLPSQWAGRNIAHNTFYALKHIAESNEIDIDIVYLVSGYCLPVQWPSFFYRKPFSLPPDHVDHPKVWDPRQSSLAILSSSDELVGGVQWISLTVDTIRVLRADDALLDRAALVYENGSHEQCPDETYIHTLVSRCSSQVQDVAFMDQSRSRWNSPSPIEWKRSDRMRRTIWDDEATSKMNTRGVLCFAHRAGYAFSRKFYYLPGICTFQDLLDYAFSTTRVKVK
jgi:hypothetical protein